MAEPSEMALNINYGDEVAGRRRLSLNVMLNCRTLLPDVDSDKDSINCFDHGVQDNNGSCGRVASRRGTSSYKACSEARQADMSLRTICFRAFLDGVTLTQLKLSIQEGQVFPSILIPELLSWAIHLDKSPRFLLPILQAWPTKDFVLSEVFPLAFEGRTVDGSHQRSRFKLNGFNTIAFGAVSRVYAWRYDCAASAVISAISKLLDSEGPTQTDCKIEKFDLRGVPLSDADFCVLAQMTLIRQHSKPTIQRK